MAALRFLLLWLALALPAAAQVWAQDLAPGQLRSPVLTIDTDRLWADTAYGRRLQADLLGRTEALRAENARIAAELTAEERSLTERRPSMDPEAFRAEADAFDARVQRIRAEQDAKERELEQAVAAARQAFLGAVAPTLGRLMAESGAAVILDRRQVFLSANVVDITDEAIAAIDRDLGSGGDAAASSGPGDASAGPTTLVPAPAVPAPAPAVGAGAGDGPAAGD
jgi:Skp family chaperone for outer membrane proteins